MSMDVGMLLVALGALAFVARLLLTFRGTGKGSGLKGEAVIFVGLIPLAFGNDKETVLIAALLAVGAILIILLMAASGTL